MTLKHLFLFLCFPLYVMSQDITETEIAVSKFIDGTLATPAKSKSSTLAIIIAGSGPTDRDGNQNFLKSNLLKKLADDLTNQGIATFRYDKRIVKQIRQNNVDADMSFDDFVTDAASVITHFKKAKQFSKIYVIGHSQGSLVGLLAAEQTQAVDGFISLAGAGQSIDAVIQEQIEKTAPSLAKDSKVVFDKLRAGETTDEFPPALASVFNKQVQPFIMNWMQYDPKLVIAKLNIPILLVNGTKDLQVSEAEAQLLKEAATNVKLTIIKDMNHVMVTIAGDDLENSKSYNEAQRPLAPELITAIVGFIK